MIVKLSKIFMLALTSALTIALGACVSIPQQPLMISQGENYTYVAAHSDSICKVARTTPNLAVSSRETNSLNANHIALLNWNVYKGQRENWAAEFRQLSANQDIITIQEAYLNDELNRILQENSYNWDLNTAFDYNDIKTGVMTASTVKSAYTCALRQAEPLIRIPKTALINRYPIGGTTQQLLVANIHSINFSLGTDAYKEQIQAMMAIIQYHDGPLIVAGDFNTWSEERMQIVESMARELALDALTYPSHNRTRIFGNAIDHVYYRGLEPIRHEVIKVDSSDHNPIKVTFRTSRTSV